MGSSTRSRGSRNMSGRWAVDCTRTSAYAENGGYIQYIIYIYIYIQRFLESRWIYLWAVTCCLVLLSFFIYREVCASETCKGPCKIASEFQVSRWRAAELQIAQKERKKERKNDLLFLNMLMFSSYSAASFQRAYHISQNRWKGLQNHRKTEVHISRCIIYLIQTSLLRMFVFWDIVAVNFRWTSWGRCGFCWSWPWNKQSKQHMNGTWNTGP